MFTHRKQLQYEAKPEQPDPLYAKKLQELIGGQWGEISVMMMYLFQGWNCRGPAKYRDMLLDIGTEEMAHVEMLATMVARLLEGASVEEQEAAAAESSVVGAILSGNSPKEMIMAGAMNPKHAIVHGLGAAPADSTGIPWNASYITSSGNLLADFRLNLTAESEGRLQACRLYQMTTDEGVRDMLSFLIARDRMHQNQWMAAIEELEEDGLEQTPVPSAFPEDKEYSPAKYQFWNLSEGDESSQGRWAAGPTVDKKGEFEYVGDPAPLGPAVTLGPADPELYSTSNSMH